MRAAAFYRGGIVKIEEVEKPKYFYIVKVGNARKEKSSRNPGWDPKAHGR